MSDIKRIQMQRDAWKALAESMLECLDSCLDGPDPNARRAVIDQVTVEAWQQRARRLTKP